MDTILPAASPAFTRVTRIALVAAAITLSNVSFATAPGIPVPPVSKKIPHGPVAGTQMSEAYVRNLAKVAYIWGWPMVNMHNRHIVFSKVPESGLGDGVLPLAPLNRLTMLTDYIKPEERAVATPNQDVVYGFGLLWLEKEPVVFQVPDFGDRFWLYQLGDQRTDTLGGVGKMYGTKPGFYMVVGPNWNGSVPKGIKQVFRSPTNLAYVIPRAFLDDTAQDRKTIQPLVNQIMAYPLGEYDGKIKTKDWSKIPTLSDPSGGSQGGGGETQWVKPEAFFAELPAVMKEVPPQPGEEVIYGWIGSLLDAAAKDPKIADTLKQAAIDADKEMMPELHQYSFAGVPVGNGWVAPMNGAEFGTDYYSRAAAAKANIFANPRRESAYYGLEYAPDKTRLNGASAYRVTFAKGELPPVNGFWSLTLYDNEHFFAPNDINRFSVGTKNKDLVYGADGSLTVYVQHERPAADQVANWLPAPAGDFELFIRAYWPRAELLEGKWTPPAAEKAN